MSFFVLRFWIFFRLGLVFVPKNLSVLVSVFIVVYGFSVFFSLWLLVFVNITNGFLDLVSDVVFSFSYLGSGFLSI